VKRPRTIQAAQNETSVLHCHATVAAGAKVPYAVLDMPLSPGFVLVSEVQNAHGFLPDIAMAFRYHTPRTVPVPDLRLCYTASVENCSRNPRPIHQSCAPAPPCCHRYPTRSLLEQLSMLRHMCLRIAHQG